MTRRELTKTTKNSFDSPNVLSKDEAASAPSPHRDPSKEFQGARQDVHDGEEGHPIPFERVRSTMAVGSRAGGAPHSKWTRKSRPWNVSPPTAVVAFPSIRERWLTPSGASTASDHASPSASTHAVADRGIAVERRIRANQFSRSPHPGERARSALGGSCGQGTRKGSRILDSPVRCASGRGSSDRAMLLVAL